jgi:hypothetical protein
MVYDFLKEQENLRTYWKNYKSLLRLKYYYFNDGYFDVTTKATLDTVKPKQGAIKYLVNTGQSTYWHY